MDFHTFVIPAYNQSPYLETCIRHLKMQTTKSAIIITTSTPNQFIKDLVQKYDLKYFINTGGMPGIASDWNFALSKAETKWVTIAHQDDIYEPDYTEKMLKQVSKTGTKSLIAFSDYYDMIADKQQINSLNAFVKRAMLLPFLLQPAIKSKLLKKIILLFGDPICCPTVMLNKELLPNFSFSAAYTCALDWLAWYQLARQSGYFIYVSDRLVGHRIHAESETTLQLSLGKRQQEEKMIFKMMWGSFAGSLLGAIYAAGHKHNAVR